jgi:ubiquitin-conjugating enzyme E2 variant
MRTSTPNLCHAIAVAGVAAVLVAHSPDQVWGWTTAPGRISSSHPVTSSTTLSRRRPAVELTVNSLSCGRSINNVALSSALVDSDTTSSSSSSPAERSSTSSQQQEKQKKSYLDDGFVFGLEGSGLQRPVGKQAQIVVEGDSLETTPVQRLIVWSTLGGNLLFAIQAFQQMLIHNNGNIIQTTIQATLLGVSSWILADLGSGVLHWSVDNYGNGRTPVFGSIIAAFQGHHSAPWTITERGFENNVYKLCTPFGLVTVGLISLLTGPFTAWFMTIFCTMEILSQEFHKWSHTTKTQVPAWVNKLQDMGVTIGRAPHAQHHIAPYDGNYCIISGICNPTLDRYGVFRRLEHWVYKWNGVESNAWKLDPQLKQRTLNGDYMLPQQP